MKRRTFLKAAVAAAAGAGIIGYSLADKRPSLDDIAGVAHFIESNGVDVRSFQDNGWPLIVYMPDLHYTSVHKLHANRIRWLHQEFGINTAFLEGQVGKVTPKDVEEDFGLLLKLQEKFDEHAQLVENEAEIEKEEPAKITSMQDYLAKANPLMRLVYEGFQVFGAESPATQDIKEDIDALQGIYSIYCEKASPYFAELKEIESLRKRIKSRIELNETAKALGQEPSYPGIEELAPELEQKAEEFLKDHEDYRNVLAEIRANMDPYKANLPIAFPDYDEGIEFGCHTPFVKALFDLDNQLNVKRGFEAVDLILKRMTDHGWKAACLVYGDGHSEDIIPYFTEKGVSYICLDI